MTRQALAAAVIVLAGASQTDQLKSLRWLAGCWQQQRAAATTIEMWMSPAGGLMLGGSRTVAGGALREWEQLRLSVRDGKVVYTALPSGQQMTDFTATAVSDSGFTVENLQHDFPQRIIYRRRGVDSLVARIEGNTPQGLRGVDFPMKRVSCEAQP
jgi:hypothetical protein